MEALILSLFAVLLLPNYISGQELAAEEIIRKANNIMNQEASLGKMKLIITTTSGNKRELFYDSWTKNRGEKNLIRYTGPRRIKDQAMLLLNNADDIWSYDPRTNRVRKLASHAKKQKMQGSDFAYEDMGSGNDFVENFTHTRLPGGEKDGAECYRIEMVITEGRDSNYSRMIAWIDKSNFVIRSIDYFDEKDPQHHLKTLRLTDIKTIDNVPTPMTMTMLNHDDRSQTTGQILEISYNVDLNDALFTERGLRK